MFEINPTVYGRVAFYVRCYDVFPRRSSHRYGNCHVVRHVRPHGIHKPDQFVDPTQKVPPRSDEEGRRRWYNRAPPGVASVGQPATALERYSDPSVRREWRSLTLHECAEWITAVKVNHPEHASRIADNSLPSVFTRYLTTLLWCQPSTQPTP